MDEKERWDGVPVPVVERDRGAHASGLAGRTQLCCLQNEGQIGFPSHAR